MSGGRTLTAGRKKALVVCGPTASGKSELSDALADATAEGQTETGGGHTPTIVVDSMQVYRELPVITNQARRRPAELVGVVSVTEQWTVARHRAGAEEILGNLPEDRPDTHFVLDAGTGMYLNAILLDIPLSPKVSPEVRRYAEEATNRETNPRRATRSKELALAGAPARGSIWDGGLRYDTSIFYLRPDRSSLDAAIARRSAKITQEGLEEAGLIRRLLETGPPVNPSVLDSVGVRELTRHLSGDLSIRQAEDRINARTRQLARRQMRWFDKLVRTLEGRASIHVLTQQPAPDILHGMHGIIRS
jgi:tRNA dimethylallyltransferase